MSRHVFSNEEWYVGDGSPSSTPLQPPPPPTTTSAVVENGVHGTWNEPDPRFNAFSGTYHQSSVGAPWPTPQEMPYNHFRMSSEPQHFDPPAQHLSHAPPNIPPCHVTRHSFHNSPLLHIPSGSGRSLLNATSSLPTPPMPVEGLTTYEPRILMRPASRTEHNMPRSHGLQNPTPPPSQLRHANRMDVLLSVALGSLTNQEEDSTRRYTRVPVEVLKASRARRRRARREAALSKQEGKYRTVNDVAINADAALLHEQNTDGKDARTQRRLQNRGAVQKCRRKHNERLDGLHEERDYLSVENRVLHKTAKGVRESGVLSMARDSNTIRDYTTWAIGLILADRQPAIHNSARDAVTQSLHLRNSRTNKIKNSRDSEADVTKCGVDVKVIRKR